MKKIKLLTPILSIGIAATTIAPLASCSCNATPIVLDKELTDLGYSVKSYKLGYLKDSYIELNTPNNRAIDDICIVVGDITLTKGEHLAVDGSTIYIDGNYMVDTKVSIKSIKLVRQLTGITVSGTKEWTRAQTIKTSDLTVKLTYDDGSFSDPLTWNTDYTISKGETVLTDFGDNGYKFTTADATAGFVTFNIKSVAYPDYKYAFAVNVDMGPAIQEDFIKAYKAFLVNYESFTTQYGKMSFGTNAKYYGQTVTKASITYDKNMAIATFSEISSSPKIYIAGADATLLDNYLNTFDENLYTKEFTITDDLITYKVTSKSDSTQYETRSLNKYSYITNWVNTFKNTELYKDTNLTDITYHLNPGKFNGIYWNTVIEAINVFEASSQTAADAVTLCKALGVTSATEQTDAKTTLETYIVGKKGTLLINNLYHNVVCIGALQDKDTNDNLVALTFQFDNLLSHTVKDEKTGTETNELMGCCWNTIDSEELGSNHDYTKSVLRNNLSKDNSAAWYTVDKGKLVVTKIETENRSVLQMLSNDETGSEIVANAIKTTQHLVATNDGEWAQNSYTDKIFIPNFYNTTADPDKRTQSICQEVKADNPVYKYYSDTSTENARRLRKDLNGDAWYYWIASPAKRDTDWTSFAVYKDGGYGKLGITGDCTYGIAPAFAI